MKITIHPGAEQDLREAAQEIVALVDRRRPGYGGKRWRAQHPALAEV